MSNVNKGFKQGFKQGTRYGIGLAVGFGVTMALIAVVKESGIIDEFKEAIDPLQKVNTGWTHDDETVVNIDEE